MITPIVTITPESLTKMKECATVFSRYPSEFQKAFKATGLMGLGVVQKEYDQRSMGKEGRWQPLSEATVLLRRRGSGKKIKNQADLMAKKAQPLKDTGQARRSLSFGAKGNILEPTNIKVSFGSRIKYLLPHMTGFISTFVFDQEKRDRFFKNVQVLEPNPRKLNPKQPNRKYKARTWSAFAWQKWKMLSNMHGKQFKVPARPIWDFSEATPDQLQRLARPLVMTMQRLFKKRGR